MVAGLHEEARRRFVVGRVVEERCGVADACTVAALHSAAARGHDELFDEHEENLLEIAGETRPEQFRIAMRRRREIADDLDDDGDRDPEKPYRRRRLYLSKLPDAASTSTVAWIPSPAKP